MEGSKLKTLTGVVPIIPIPFDEHDEIDEEALRGLVEFAVSSGVGAICLPAYASEFYKLSDQERIRVVRVAVDQAAGRVQVIAQSNHGSARVALGVARAHVENGADLISVAIPRQFALPNDDLLGFLTMIINGAGVPCLVQDFNPGGITVDVRFVTRLMAECPNFLYLKLEEALLAPKVIAIREATKEKIGILEGWGGLYMMELIPLGICGIMPGLALADGLNLAFKLRAGNKSAAAFQLYEKLLPQLVFTLQNLELFLYCEKRLLQARGLLSNARCRNAAFTPDPDTVRYVDELNERMMQALDKAALSATAERAGLAHIPSRG
ncbi:MAG: dihydrodipicolinate synthase family protein [Terriglobia bacterium]|jgi:4-hydroxy-tetrahydrodipicolinate synthase